MPAPRSSFVSLSFHEPDQGLETRYRYLFVGNEGARPGSAIGTVHQLLPLEDGQTVDEERKISVKDGGLKALMERAVKEIRARHPGLEVIEGGPVEIP